MARIGIDLGGTKIEGLALGPDGGELARRRVATPRDDYDGTIGAIADIVAWLEARAGRATVGVAMPGAISPRTGLVKNANSTWLNGRRFGDDLAAALGRQVRIENDANCLAASEAADGAAAGRAVVFGVILGTGVGGGIAVGGRPICGPNAIAGEWGHNPLPWPTAAEIDGPPCYCGKSGCIETWLSGPGMAADHARAGGGTMDAPAIVAAASDGDTAALATIGRYRDRLARSLATVINVLDPDVVVIGGGLSRIATIYDGLSARIAEWCFSDGVSTEVVPALHGDASGVRGAARLWPEEEPKEGR